MNKTASVLHVLEQLLIPLKCNKNKNCKYHKALDFDFVMGECES